MKLVVANPKNGKTMQKELEENQAKTLYGKKIYEVVKGESLGLTGYELQITGGSDKQGFPMRSDLRGTGRKKIMISSGPGFHPKTKGERRRKSVRGNTVSAETAQLNMQVVKEGAKSLEKTLGKEEEKKPEKKPEKKEDKKPEKKEEKPKEKPKKDEKKPEKQEKPEEKKKETEPKKEGKKEAKK
jgi:small subunit ribosomal protein S6e